MLCDLFLDKTPVVTSADFNFIYDIFLGQESKQLTAKEFGTISFLFLSYGKKPKSIAAKDAKMMKILFFDKTPVITTPDFNVLYDIFLGHESKKLTAKQFDIIINLFMSYSKKPKMQFKD